MARQRVRGQPYGDGGGGAVSIIGSMFGIPIGGGFKLPTDPEKDIASDIAKSGADMNDEDAAIDANNAARAKPRVKASTPSFKDYSVSNPMMDSIFNRGRGQAQANAMNMQGQQMMFEAAQRQAIQDAANKAAMEREMYGQNAASNRQADANVDARNLANQTYDNTVRSKYGVSSSTPVNQFDAINSAIGRNMTQAQLEATQQPGYNSAVAADTIAKLQAQQAINFRNTLVDSAPGTQVVNAFGKGGNEPGRLFAFPGSDNQQVLEPEYMTLPNGQKIQTGVKSISTNTPRSGGYLDDIESKRNAMIKAAEGSAQPALGNFSEGYVNNLTGTPTLTPGTSPMRVRGSVAPPPAETLDQRDGSPNTALIPQIGAGISEAGSALGEGMSDALGIPMDYIIKYLFNSNRKVRKPNNEFTPPMRYSQ